VSYSNFTDNVRYNGDWIVAASYVDAWYTSLDDFIFALDGEMRKARQDAIDCFINLRQGDPDVTGV
jgi:hypothetical protein